MIKWNLRTKYTNLLSVLKNQSNALSNFKPSDPAIFKSDTDNPYYSIVLNRRYTFVCGENKYIFQKVLNKIQLKKTILSLTAFANERIKLEMFLWRMLACAADRLASVHWDVIVGHTLAAFLFTRKEDGPIRRNDFKVCLVLFVPKIFQIICVRAKFDKIYACLVLIPTNLWGRGWKLTSFIYCMDRHCTCVCKSMASPVRLAYSPYRLDLSNKCTDGSWFSVERDIQMKYDQHFT